MRRLLRWMCWGISGIGWLGVAWICFWIMIGCLLDPLEEDKKRYETVGNVKILVGR